MVEANVEEIALNFISGPIQIHRIESGHINNSFRVKSKISEEEIVLQNVNPEVFKDPQRVFRNYDKIKDPCSGVIPDLVLTESGNSFIESEHHYWRAFKFIADSKTLLTIESDEQAYSGARMYGTFLNCCSVIDPTLLEDTIPDFHHLPFRIKQFNKSLLENRSGRKGDLKDLINDLEHFYSLGREFEKAIGILPKRVTHNDTKASNLLYSSGNEAMAVIDLDTVMSGLLITDFGDIVRSFCPGGAEDDPYPESSEPRKYIFKALLEGFLESVSVFITRTEKDMLATGAQFICYEQALRFFTDHLNGDVYYHSTREKQNLDRGIHQLNILKGLKFI